MDLFSRPRAVTAWRQQVARAKESVRISRYLLRFGVRRTLPVPVDLESVEYMKMFDALMVTLL